MEYNNEFEVIDTEEKAYFLGFMYADGCLSAIERKNSTYIKYQVQMSLADEDIIKKLHSIFPFFNLQIFDFGKYKSTWSKQFALRKANRKLFDDLTSQGIPQRKSQSSSILNIPNIDNSLISHFIRGFFDGDGSISISAKRPNLRRVEICSASKSFLFQIKNIIESNNINCPIFRRKNNNPSALYVLEWINIQDVTNLGKFLYKDCTIYLNRKKEKFDTLKFINIEIKNPICQECSLLLNKKVKRQAKRKWKITNCCIKCNRKF
jgi:hypothetical protein